MEPNSTLGEPIGVVHVTINGQKVPANVYADRTCIMPDGTIRKVKQEVVDALLAKKRAAEIPAQTPAQQAPAAQPFITRVQSQPVVQPACRTSARCSDSADHDAVWRFCSWRLSCTSSWISSACNGFC